MGSFGTAEARRYGAFRRDGWGSTLPGAARGGRFGALLVLLLATAPVRAAPAPGAIAIAGAGFTRVLRFDALAGLPTATVVVTAHDGTTHRLAGPLLWAVLGRAGVVATDPKERARAVVLVTGRDGYVAALALGELDPVFEGKTVVLALSSDGTALPSPRLAVPDDHHPGRDVREVDRIDLR